MTTLQEALAFINLLRAIIVQQNEDAFSPKQLRYLRGLVKADFACKYYRPTSYWLNAKETADKLGVRV